MTKMRLASGFWMLSACAFLMLSCGGEEGELGNRELGNNVSGMGGTDPLTFDKFFRIFDLTAYVYYNPDVAASCGLNPGVDYSNYTTAHFEQAAAICLQRHWGVDGRNEGRRASVLFSVRYYQRLYPDLKQVFGDNWESLFKHWAHHGMSEKRIGSRCDSHWLAPDYIRQTRPDVVQAVGASDLGICRWWEHMAWSQEVGAPGGPMRGSIP